MDSSSPFRWRISFLAIPGAAALPGITLALIGFADDPGSVPDDLWLLVVLGPLVLAPLAAAIYAAPRVQHWTRVVGVAAGAALVASLGAFLTVVVLFLAAWSHCPPGAYECPI